MAFGSFFKKIITGAKNIIGKVAPVIRKGLDVVSRVAPTIGNAIGGPIGSVVNTIGNLAGKAGGFMDNAGISNMLDKVGVPRLGMKGGVQRFDVPLLKGD